MLKRIALLGGVVMGLTVLAACNLGDVAGAAGGVVPTTGNTSSDATAAQQFIPVSIPGYTTTEANSITGALSAVGGSASVLTGNPVVAAAIGAVDGLIQCYNGVGAAAARIFIANDAATAIMNGGSPSFGAMAVINGDRVANNFLPCALGQVQGLSSQSAAPTICSNNGNFVVNNETLYYLYAATSPELCSAFEAAVPARTR
ncbi:MAG: hypothetical protein IAE89_02425 [Anaerolineae bacterium]|nr:hypothetical protein [Anaerolineae bacterium]